MLWLVVLGLCRYFGLGRTVMCLHQDAIFPSAVELPHMRVAYSLNAQLMWLKQEAAELCQVRDACARLLAGLAIHLLLLQFSGGTVKLSCFAWGKQVVQGCQALSPLA